VILVDTSVWIDHLRSSVSTLRLLLDQGQVLGHPFVRGELACGNLRQRADILDLLAKLPPAEMADDDEVMQAIELHGLMGRGIGYVDAHLLAATILTPGAALWTRDERLARVARRLGIEAGATG